MRTTFLVLITMFLDCTVAEARIFRRFRTGFPGVSRARAIARENNNVQRIAGFSNLAIVGNRIIELDAFGRFKQDLFINERTGQLFGRFALDRNTNQQLKEFYLREFEKFSDAARAGRRGARRNLGLVSRFLEANGAGRRNLDVALNFGVTLGNNPQYSGFTPNQLNQAVLLDLLNTVSDPTTSNLVTPANLFVSGNRARVEGLDRFFRIDRLGLLSANNPYACTGVLRTDWLAFNGTQPAVYHALQNIPARIDGRGGLFETLGVDERDQTAFRNFTSRIIVDADDESLIAKAPYRVLERQRRNFGLPFRQSFDFSNNQTSGAATGSGDVVNDPFRATDNHIAREMLWIKKNGFLAGALGANNLTNGQVNRADSAPADVTRSEVTNVINCLNCHSGGFLGGKNSLLTNRPYTDLHRNIPGFARNGFTSNALYAAEVDRDNALFMASKKRAGAFVPKLVNNAFSQTEAAPALFDLVQKYRDDVSFADLKKEFESVLGPLNDATLRASVGNAEKFKRVDVEKFFCGVYSRLGGRRGGVEDLSTPVGRRSSSQGRTH